MTGGSSAPPPRCTARAPLVLAAGLFLATTLLYLPVRHHEFLNYDDDAYVTANPRVAAGISRAGAAWAFGTFTAGNWHPLTWISHMLDVSLFGMRPAGHHLMNVALHGAASASLFLTLRGATGALLPPLLAATLFTLHPLRVESVAWVSERKDVLSGLLFVLALGAHVRFARRPSLARRSAVLLWVGLAILAKPTSVTLPLVMLVLDFWPLGRMRRIGIAALLAEKAPLLLASAVGAAVAVTAQASEGSLIGTGSLAVGVRLANAAVSGATYLVKTAWPFGLAHYYPYPRHGPPAWEVASASVLLAAVTGAAIRLRLSRPWFTAGWLWYLATLAPVSGIVQVGSQAMADRYTYLPLMGVSIAAAWALGEAVPRGTRVAATCAAAALCALVALSLASRRQLAHWGDSVTLSEHTISVTGENWFVENNLGAALAARGRRDEAIRHYWAALRIRPKSFEATNNMAVALLERGDAATALRWFDRAVELRPGEPALHENRARALRALGRPEEAARENDLARRLRAGGNEGGFSASSP